MHEGPRVRTMHHEPRASPRLVGIEAAEQRQDGVHRLCKYIVRLQRAGHLRRQPDSAMARVLLLGFVLSTAVALTVQAALPPAKYTDKYDNVNLDRILSNGRILTNYIKCLMDEGPCTSEGRELKSKSIKIKINVII